VKHNVTTPKYDVSRSTPTFAMISFRSSVYPHTQSINVSNEIVFHGAKYDYSALYIYIYMYEHSGARGGTVGLRGTQWRSWLRHRATNQKVTFSIPGGVTDIILLVTL
jgi:hypothetical protein